MSTIEALLDTCHRTLKEGNIRETFITLAEELTHLRLTMSDDDWSEHIVPACKAHGLAELLNEDPFTRRARDKPRGYAGDAEMMDYLYFRQPPADCSNLGKKMFKATTASHTGKSVRWRRRHIAALINKLAGTHKKVSVLSVACGHCRESELLKQRTRDTLRNFTALDQDDESLRVVQETFEGPLTTLCRNVVNGSRDAKLKNFHFVYSAGLFDYLDDRVAKLVSTTLLKRARPGGTVLIANFTPDNWARGYMESFMDWQLKLRSKEDMRRLIPAKGVSNAFLYNDPFRNVVYLRMTKA